MRLFLLLSLFVCPFLIGKIFAQDIHLSHLHSGPILYNPAMTGIYNGDARFIANYKSQWKSIGTDYRTCYGSAEMKTRSFGRSTSTIGLGLEVFSDKAGDLDYSQQGAQLSLSGIKLLDGRNGKKFMSVALKSGYVSNSFDFTKIVAFSEETSITRDASTSRTGYFDMSAGIAWMHELDSRKHSYYLGASMSHINKPVISFNLDENTAVGNELYRRIIIHGGGDFTLKNKISAQPSFILMDQGPNREITVGSFISYNNNPRTKRKEAGKFSLQLGAWFRAYVESDEVRGMDALIFAAKANVANTSITFSYDMNISSLAAATTGKGGPEISIIQLIEWNQSPKYKVECPAFY